MLVPSGFSGIPLSSTVSKGREYTVVYKRGIGYLNYIDLEQFLRNYLRNNLKVVSVNESGILERHIYVTVIPVKSGLTANFINLIITRGINLFKEQSLAGFVIAPLTFVEIRSGSYAEVEKEEEAKSFSAVFKRLIYVWGFVIVGVAVYYIYKRD